MIVLGIHFGHDASIAVLRDGVPLFVYEKERYARVKYAIGIDGDDVAYVLDRCGLTPADVDYCGITSTQSVEYFFFDERLSFEIGENGVKALASGHDRYDPEYQRYDPVGVLEWEKSNEASGGEMYFWRYFRQYWDRDFDAIATHPPYEQFIWLPRWQDVNTFEAIAADDYTHMLTDGMRRSFHVPVRVTLFGRTVPGILMSHHFAHAAGAFFDSGFDTAAVLTHDGGYDESGYLGGMFYYGRGTDIYPLTPHFLNLGPQYNAVSDFVGLRSPGKTMGLAGYGTPALYTPELAGNIFDEPGAALRHTDAFSPACLERARALDYDTSALADLDRMTQPVNADIAATLQRAFEETMLRAASTLHAVLQRHDLTTPNLCFSGGTALNCPANTLVYNDGPFETLFVPPACNDTGLSLGSAYFLYHSLLGMARSTEPRSSASIVYLGSDYSASDLDAALAAVPGPFTVERSDEPERDAAALLAAGAVIGWFEGRSEIGPRALGHRSILASPAIAENWFRVNEIKRREQWRPLAPMVLESKARAWFADAPPASPHMLFNATVIGDRLPAIKHVDGTARIQTVTATDGRFHAVLTHFDALTGIPVLMNTSLNGPGEPIVQSPADALRFFAGSGMDAIYIDGVKVTLAPVAAPLPR